MGIQAIYMRLSAKRLSEILADEEGELLESTLDEQRLPTFDLGSCWNELHILLTGADALEVLKNGAPVNALSEALVGGSEIEGSDGGYGPCRFLTPDKVTEVASQVSSLTYEDLATKHEVATGVGDDVMEEYFDEFKEFFMSACKSQEAVLATFT